MPRGSKTYGQRTELKNINSFRFVKQAIDYEIARQVDLLESGGKVVQETRLWDPHRNETRPMRSKEDAHDYRYFPEPDLPVLHVAPEAVEEARRTLPELPKAKVARFQSALGLSPNDAKTLCAEKPLAEFFESCLPHVHDPKKLANWFLGELMRLMKEDGGQVGDLKFTPVQLGALLSLVEQGVVSGNGAKEAFGVMFKTGRDPKEIIAEKGLGQVSDAGAVQVMVDEVLTKNPKDVESYRSGKKQLLGFFVGQVMKSMKGKGNPTLVNELLKKALDKTP
jgi:aspartyl-tRNA(Asn)/glutamyl-tRNA(Gln) amidotransferase subunit B